MSFRVGMTFLEYQKKQVVKAQDKFLVDIHENLFHTIKCLVTQFKLDSVEIDLAPLQIAIVTTPEREEMSNSLDRLKKFLYNNREEVIAALKGFRQDGETIRIHY